MTQTPTLSPSQTQIQPRYTQTDEDRARQKRIARAWQAYNGQLEKPLDKTPEGIDPNVLSNRCVGIVDGGVNFLFGKELEISIKEDAPEAAQTLLDSTWGRKEQRIPLLQKLAMNGAMAGTAFLRIVPSRPNPDKATTYRLIVVDPATVSVETAPQDCETPLLYCLEYTAMEEIDGKMQHVTYREEMCRIDPDGNALKDMPDTDDTWMISHWTQVGRKGDWTAAGEPIRWPYSFPPLFACQNLPTPNDFWGKPDITDDLIQMNESLNLTQSCINLVQLLYSEPLLYATGTGEQLIARNPGYVIGLPTDQSKIVAVSLASDTANALSFAADLRSDIDEQSGVPGVATGRIKDMPRGTMSGIAIELMFMSLLKKTDTKRCVYGEMIIDVCQALFTLAGLSQADEPLDVTLAWQNPLPADDLLSVQAAIGKLELGISKHSLQREIGYDPDEEMELAQSEDAQKLLAWSRGQAIAPPSPLPDAVPGTKPLPGQKFPVPAPGTSAAPQGEA